MKQIAIIGLVVAGIWAMKKSMGVRGMDATAITIDNIRRGVANGWYTCELTNVNGKTAVRLSGNTIDGKPFTGVYPISSDDWNTLKNEGYKIV